METAHAVVDVDAAVAALRAWLDGTAMRQRLHVWLSGSLSRPFIAPPVPGVRTKAEALRVAQALVAQHTGLAGQCEVWLDDGSAQNARMAVAMRSDMLESLLGVAKGARHRLVSVRPWWTEALRAALQRDPKASLLAAQDCDSLTVLAGREGKFQLATTLTPVVDQGSADAALARLLLSTDVSSGGQSRVRLMPLQEPRPSATLDMALGAFAEFST